MFNNKCDICLKTITRKEHKGTIKVTEYNSKEGTDRYYRVCDQCSRDFDHHIEQLIKENREIQC